MEAEREIYQGRAALVNHAILIGMGGLLVLMGLLLLLAPEARGQGLGIVVFGAFLVGLAYAKVHGTSYRITNERISQRNGLLSRRTSEVETADIRNVRVDQGVIQRIFGVGNVHVLTAGTDGSEIVFRGVKSPKEIGDRVREQRRAG